MDKINGPLLPIDDVRVYTLPEVAAITRVSERALKQDCAAGRLEHLRRGRTRGMTIDHIRKLIAAHTVGAATATQMSPMDWALQAARRNARRGTPRRSA